MPRKLPVESEQVKDSNRPEADVHAIIAEWPLYTDSCRCRNPKD